MKEREQMTRRQALWVLAALAGGTVLAASAQKNSLFRSLITPTHTSLVEPPSTPASSPSAINTEIPESTSTPEESRDVEIILTGDVLLGRMVMNTSLELNDPKYPFLKVADTLKEADITSINLENPIIDKCPVVPNDARMVFCADPRMVEGLIFAGVDVVNLANNHTLDHGESGLAQTQEILRKNGIDYVGLENLVIKEAEGTKFGFLGLDFVSKYATDEDFELIKEADKNVDVLIVNVHWGGEYETTPREKQRQLAKRMIVNGADVVVGHHSHVVQDIDYIDGKPVFYSLGNLVFDNMKPDPKWEGTRKGLVIRLIYRDGQLIRVEQLPIEIKITSWGQPEFVNNGQ